MIEWVKLGRQILNEREDLNPRERAMLEKQVGAAELSSQFLQNAASIGMMVLTTEALITDIPEKKEAPAMPGGGMGGMGGMDY